MKKVAAAILVCLGLMQGSVSAVPPALLDGSVNDLNPRVYDALVKIYQASGGSGVLSAEAAQFLSQEILADQHVDAVETDLLVELTQDRARLVRITARNTSAETVTFGTVFGAPRRVLRELVLPQDTLDSFLTTGADGWKQLALISERSPADAVDIQMSLQQHIVSLWAQSALDNKYEPVRDFIKRADTEITTLPVADGQRAQAMLYEAFLQADAQVQDVIPNVFYRCFQ